VSAAEVAQRVRKELMSWPDVADIYGPQLGRPGQFFLRFVFRDGSSYAVELTQDEDDGA
jgi:hypothetical protein